MTTVVAVTVGYLVVCLALGLIPARKSSGSVTGYVAGDRNLGLLLMYFITGASIYSAFAFLGLPGWAYSRGAAAFYIPIYGLFALLPFYFLGPRAARVGRRFGIVTQADLLAQRFSMPSIAGVVALVSLVAFVPYLAIQIKGAGYVIHQVTEQAVSEELGGGLVYAVVATYVLRSGVLGVGWTNTFQGIFMMALAWGLGLYLPYKLCGGVGPMFEQLAEMQPEKLVPPGLNQAGESWGWGEFSSAVLVSTIGLIFWPHLFMKAFSAKDERTIRKTVVLYPSFQLFLVPLLFIGFAGIFMAGQPAEPDQILPYMLMNLDIAPILVGLFCAGALAASMSTGDAMAHAAGAIAVRDGAIRAGGAQLSAGAEKRWIQVVIVLVLVLSYVVAVTYEGSLVNMLLTAYGGIVQFAPAITAALYSRRARGGAVLAGLIAGTLVTAYFIFLPDHRPWGIHAGVYGLIVNVTVIVAGSLGRGRVQGSEFLAAASDPSGR